jgi:hypothetical protein
MMAALRRFGGRSLHHSFLNEAAYFRRIGCTYPPGVMRSSYFHKAMIYLTILRDARRTRAAAVAAP